MRSYTLTRLLVTVAIAGTVGCSAKLDAESRAQVDSIIASTEASAAKADAAATKAAAAARSAQQSAERAAAASQKAEAILFRTMQK